MLVFNFSTASVQAQLHVQPLSSYCVVVLMDRSTSLARLYARLSRTGY